MAPPGLLQAFYKPPAMPEPIGRASDEPEQPRASTRPLTSRLYGRHRLGMKRRRLFTGGGTVDAKNPFPAPEMFPAKMPFRPFTPPDQHRIGPFDMSGNRPPPRVHPASIPSLSLLYPFSAAFEPPFYALQRKNTGPILSTRVLPIRPGLVPGVEKGPTHGR